MRELVLEYLKEIFYRHGIIPKEYQKHMLHTDYALPYKDWIASYSDPDLFEMFMEVQERLKYLI